MATSDYVPQMDIGLSVPLPAYTIDPAFMAKRAEELGFDSIWYAEHPVVPVETTSPFPSTGGSVPEVYSHFTDPYIALARASAVTTTLKLGTGITLVPERNPLVLAKQVAALDHHSGGRFLFGIGTGWLREETEIMGGDFPRRWSQTAEALEVLKALWTQDEAEHHGTYFDFPPVRCFPKPAQQPHPPVIIGGSAPNVLQRVVDHADGWLPNRATPEEIATARAELDRLAAEAGRDPNSITISIYGQDPDRGLIESFSSAGADRVIVRPEHRDTEEDMAVQLETMAEAVLR